MDTYKHLLRPATLLFATCLDYKANTDAAKWLRGLVREVHRAGFDRDKKSGKKQESGQSPLYVMHIVACTRALALEGSAQAAVRKFSVVCARQAAGRAAELAWILYHAMEFDPFFRAIFAEWPQSKISKIKLVGFVAFFFSRVVLR